MLENLSSSRGNCSSKLDNTSCFGSSYNTQKARVRKSPFGKTKARKSSKKVKVRKENRCCSSIAAHNLNKSLLGVEFDPVVAPSGKIVLEDGKKAKPSFQQRTSLNLSQMFKYYQKHPFEKQSRKPSKSLQNAYRSYTSSSVTKKSGKMNWKYPSILLSAIQSKKKNTSTTKPSSKRKERKLMKILDLPLSKYSKFFAKQRKSKSKGRSKGNTKMGKVFDISSDLFRQRDSRSYSRVDRANNHSSTKRHDLLSAKKKTKSGKRSRCRDDSGSRQRSRERVENRTLECNSAINTYQNSIVRKDHSPLSFLCQDRINLEDEENLIHYIPEGVAMSNKIHTIEKNIRQQIGQIEAKHHDEEQLSEASTRQNTELEEKVNAFAQSLSEVAELHPSSCQLFSMIKEGVEDCLQRLVSREKFKNICLLDSANKTQKELTKEKVEREALECQYTEMKERVKTVMKVEQEEKELREQLRKLEQDQDKYYSQINWLKNREEEIIKRMDLNEIDLPTDRLNVFGVETTKELEEARVNKKIPKLDFEQLYKMKELDNQEDYEEEEEEQEN